QTGFSQTSGRSYRVFKDVIAVVGRYEIFVQKKTVTRVARKELRRLSELARLRRFEVVALRLNSFLKTNRQIWLVSDRTNAAGDNAEALLRYIAANPDKNIDPYFVISKRSSDYQKMVRIGKVLDVDSFKYKCLFMRADKIISSHADDYVINPFAHRVGDLVDR